MKGGGDKEDRNRNGVRDGGTSFLCTFVSDTALINEGCPFNFDS
jgi:hypothetical protein